MYDIIGDIHGQAEILVKLLEKLGYVKSEYGYKHTDRKAIFVGDFIDKGPNIIGSLQLIKQMCDNNNAYAIVGNHEYNFLTYHTYTKDGIPLREHSKKNKNQIKATQLEFDNNKPEAKKLIKWLRSLPLFLELDKIRIVHACWHFKSINKLEGYTLSENFLRSIHEKRGKKLKAINIILKGYELEYTSKKPVIQNKLRIKWWINSKNQDISNLSFDKRISNSDIIQCQTKSISIKKYKKKNKCVFFGHYNMLDNNHIVAKNLCCIDASYDNKMSISAYRWNGENKLSTKNIVHIKTLE